MISTAIYKFDVRGTHWDVAHLFEHLLIEAWHETLKQNGYSPALFGWFRGDTFEEYIFLDAGFYDKSVGNLFHTFISTPLSFSIADIEKSLAVIGAEEKSEFTVNDMDMLHKEIRRLSHRSASPTLAKDTPAPLSSQKKANLYRDASLIVTGNNLSDIEQMLFLRFKVVLIDIIIHAISDRYIFYSRGHSTLTRHDESIGYLSKITLKKGQISLVQLTDYLQDAIRNFPVEKSWPQIATHMKIYADEALWRASSIDYYRETGIMATPTEIANLASIKNIQSLLSKVTVQARSHHTLNDQWIR